MPIVSYRIAADADRPAYIDLLDHLPSLMDYSASRFGSSVDSEMTIAPSTSLGRLESTFCRDFSCCGLELDDLHDLLQHYEECHVRFDDESMPGMIDDDGNSTGTTSTPSSMPPSPRSANARNARLAASGDHKRRQTTDGVSVRPGMPLDAPAAAKGKKRSFGQYEVTNASTGAATAAGAGANTTASIQSLRRALIDGGVPGSRSNRSSPSVYSANSPFSTPSGSVPGTPVPEDANDFTFGNNGLSAFSAMSLRPNHVEDQMTPCGPPTFFFPQPGAGERTGAGANATTPGLPALNFLAVNNVGVPQPPSAKREKMSGPQSSNGMGSHAVLGGTLGAASSSSAAGGGDKDKNKDVDKPFKCPNAGCDKAYKQANGLKYHRLHGSCNKNLSGQEGASGSGSGSGSTSPQANGTPSASSASNPTAARITSPGTPTPAALSRPSNLTAGGAPQAGAFAPRPPVAGGPHPNGSGPGLQPNGNKPAAGTFQPNANRAQLASAIEMIESGQPISPSLHGWLQGPLQPNGAPCEADKQAILRSLRHMLSQAGPPQPAAGVNGVPNKFAGPGTASTAFRSQKAPNGSLPTPPTQSNLSAMAMKSPTSVNGIPAGVNKANPILGKPGGAPSVGNMGAGAATTTTVKPTMNGAASSTQKPAARANTMPTPAVGTNNKSAPSTATSIPSKK